MSLATICQNVADDLGIEELVGPVFSSRTPAAKRLVAQARRALRSLIWRGAWSELVIEYEFTADGTSDYPLPAGFVRMMNDTVWERSRYWAMRGALSPQQWQRYRSSIYGRATVWRRFRIRVPSGEDVGSPTMFSVDPAVGTTDHVSKFVFEYQSAYAVRSGIDGTMVHDWVSDDDTTVFSDMLIELGTRWRMMRRLGLAYDEEKDEYEREVDKAIARDGGMATLNLIPFYREDFIGQYSLGAFPPVPPFPAGQGPQGWPNMPVPQAGPLMPPEVARALAPFETRDWRDEIAAPLSPRGPPVRERRPSDYEIAASILAGTEARVVPVAPPSRLWHPSRPMPPLGLPGETPQMPPGS